MSIALHVLFSLIIILAMFWTNVVVGNRLVGRSSWSTRCSASLISAWFLLWLTYHASASFGVFTLANMLALWSALAVAAHVFLDGRSAYTWLRTDRIQGRGLVRKNVRSWLGWLSILVVAVLGLRLIHGLVCPPMGEHALWGQLARAAEVVQSGSLSPSPFTEPLGLGAGHNTAQVFLYAWPLLLDPSATLLPFAGAFVAFTIFVGMYATARAMFHSRARAVTVALVLSSCPAVISYCNQPDAVTITLALFTLSLSFLVRITTEFRPPVLLLCGLALGLCAAQLPPLLILAILATPVVCIGVFRASHSWRTRTSGVLFFLLGLSTVIPVYTHQGLDFGQSWRPDPTNTSEFVPEDGQAHEVVEKSGGQTLRDSLLLGHLNRGDHLGLGPFVVVLALLAIAGFAAAWPQERFRTIQILFAGIIGLQLLVLLRAPPWADTLSHGQPDRLLMLSFAAVLLLSLFQAKRLGQALLEAAIATQLALSLPLGWGDSDVQALLSWLPYLILSVALGVATWLFLKRRGARGLGLPTSALCLLLGALPLYKARSQHRSEIIDEIRSGDIYDTLPLSRAARSPGLIWRTLSEATPSRIAVARGPALSHRDLLRFPLYGAELQHRLLRIAPHPVSAEDSPAKDNAAIRWIGRLEEQEIDRVLLLGNPSVEAEWVRAHPERFEVVLWLPEHGHGLYRFHRRSPPPEG